MTEIRFSSQSAEHGYLSNFFEALIELEDPVMGHGMVWHTNENYFQYSKLLCRIRAHYSVHDIEELLEFFGTCSPGKAKRKGSTLDIEPLWWDYEESLPAMLRCNMAKFTQHEELRERLVATGDAVLIEHRPDPIWGDNTDGTGLNLLGQVLMLVRSRVSR